MKTKGSLKEKKEIIKLLLDTLNKLRSELSDEQRVKLGKVLNQDKIKLLEAKVSVVQEAYNKMKR